MIEIVSPTDQHAGADRDAYLRKQVEVLGSEANLMEIDLLRSGRRPFLGAVTCVDDCPVPGPRRLGGADQPSVGGSYTRGAVVYTKPLHSPLSPDQAKWADEFLRRAGVIV